MRTEISNALKLAAEARASLARSMAENSSYHEVDPEQKARLELLWQRHDRLRDCIREHPAVQEAYAGYPGSLFIYLDATGTKEVVVELSLYGPIAAVFQYGDVAQSVLDQVQRCLDGLGM